MTLEDVMIRNVVTVSMDETLTLIQQLFAQGHFHHLLVLAETRRRYVVAVKCYD